MDGYAAHPKREERGRRYQGSPSFQGDRDLLEECPAKRPANPLSADVSCGTPDQVIPMVGYRTRRGETFRAFHHGCRKPTELQERGRNRRDRESLYRNR